jgi:hypothetical protein
MVMKTACLPGSQAIEPFSGNAKDHGSGPLLISEEWEILRTSNEPL